MRELSREFQSHSFRVAITVILVLSLAATRIPLLNYLGFEASFAVGLTVAFVSGLLAIRIWRERAGKEDESPNDAIKALGVATSGLLLVPLAVLLFNALFVRNCSIISGLLYYLLLAVPSAFFGASLGFFSAAVAPSKKKLLFVLLFAGTLLHIASVTFLTPQIYAFNPLLGYFPGITYDENIDIVARLAAYRGTTIAAIVLLILLSQGLWQSGETTLLGRIRALLHQLIRYKFAEPYLALFLLIAFVASDQLGFSSSETYVESQLGGKLATRHCTILYPEDALTDVRTQKLAEFCEFTYQSVRNELRIRFAEPVKIFLFASSAQKNRAIGAGRTDLAKPWLRQIYCNVEDVESVLAHEMTHVLAAEFGIPILKIGRNAGLIEGAAMAVERMEYGSSIHRLAASALELGKMPQPEQIFSITGFAFVQNTLGYTAAGSFSRYLIDRNGIESFKQLYRTGDVEGIYGKPLHALSAEWKYFLHRYMFRDGDIERAEYLFTSLPIFAKECPRVVAATMEQARRYFSEQRYDNALRASEEAFLMNRSVEAVSLRIRALTALGKYEDAARFGEMLLEDTLYRTRLPVLRLTIGDAFFASGKTLDAVEQYDAASRSYLGTAWLEAAAIRREAIGAGQEGNAILRAHLFITDTAKRLDTLSTFYITRKSALAGYLLAREYIRRDRFAEAAVIVDAMPEAEVGDLRFLTRRLSGISKYYAGAREKAKISFWLAQNDARDEFQIADVRRWIERCSFIEDAAKSSTEQ